ncbi:conserved hypothetical protein [Culex quinquefasciatus]|uniref:Kazal-like domain-containing protein n=1 Tax=Culex quinquefasciatus TaxID=7176 RepID=B0XE38_CULQU|nr:conserved hypothetical protein [Culex quinquefasciatus]|eukprot:XP_001867910.1 conserved hypothetical protein [Culex quinquefasciatus]
MGPTDQPTGQVQGRLKRGGVFLLSLHLWCCWRLVRRLDAASPYLNSSPFSTSQPVRATFLGQSVNELTTAPIRVVSRPQQSNNNNLPPPLEPRKPSRSRDFYGCLSNCLTLSHYNPVCGTDHTTYHNVYKLDCANRCGARPRVQVRRPGIC